MLRPTRLPVLLAILTVLLTLAASSPLRAQQAITVNFGPGRDATQPGTVTFTPRGNQTEITLNLQPIAPGVRQPAHIHQDPCPGVGPVTVALTFPVDGRSTTIVDAPLSDLLAGRRGQSINIHRSEAEAGIYTACVNMSDVAAAARAPAPTRMPVTGSGGFGTAGVPAWILALGAGAVALGATRLVMRRSR